MEIYGNTVERKTVTCEKRGVGGSKLKNSLHGRVQLIFKELSFLMSSRRGGGKFFAKIRPLKVSACYISLVILVGNV